MTLALILQLVLFVACANSTANVLADEGPTASLLCRNDGSNKVECAVTAQVPNPKHPPQYKWAVSEGKLDVNGTPNITVDATETKTDSIVVTVVVRWPDCPRVCDRSLHQTVQLKRRSQ
jgi:hypothetical protein